MDKLIQARKIVRTNHTKLINGIEDILKEANPELPLLRSKLEVLQQVRNKLDELDEQVMNKLLDDKVAEDELSQEADRAMDYSLQYSLIKQKVMGMEQTVLIPQKSDIGSEAGNDEDYGKFRFPKLELRKFSGDFLDWLPFWAHYRSIHEDTKLNWTYKFQYLLQSIDKETEAYKSVAAFPFTPENYEEAIATLKSTYGREDVLHQLYIRELLKLQINNNHKDSFEVLWIKTESNLRALKTINLQNADPDTWLFPIVESNIPEDILLNWQLSPESKLDGSKENPKRTRLDILMDFVRRQIEAKRNVKLAHQGFFEKSVTTEKQSSGKGKEKLSSTQKKKSKDDIPTVAGLHLGEDTNCAFCDKPHETKECFKARSMSYKQKEEILKAKKLCTKCFRGGHKEFKCHAKMRCWLCNKANHHTIMCSNAEQGQEMKREDSTHAQATSSNYQPFNTQQMPTYNFVEKTNDSQPSGSKPKQDQSNVGAFMNNVCTDQIILQTLWVYVNNGNKRKLARVFFDTGAQRSYIRTALANEMGFKPVVEQEARHSVFGGGPTQLMKHSVFPANLSSLDGEYSCNLIVRTQDKISNSIPRLNNDHAISQRLKEEKIVVSDMGTGHPPIDILIGADAYGNFLIGCKQLSPAITAIQTKFGWTLVGVKEYRDPTHCMSMSVLSMHCTSSEINQLWSLETLGINDPADDKTKQVKEIELKQSFFRQVSRKPDGRYVVPLPWKEGHPPLPNNKSIAQRRLQSTLKKLKDNHRVKEYGDIFREWEKEGIIERVTMDESIEDKDHYLPHRPIFKNSSTTPVRPVFDASCKVGKNVSLNECLETGANYVKMIPDLLLRFREKKYGIISDIRKAFQMIEIQESDRNAMKFLWWSDEEQQMIEYRHKRVMFGATCSPFILGAVLEYHLTQVKAEEKSTATTLLNTLYVDNCVHSESTLDDYYEFRNEATELLADAKMDLRMWMSNGDEINEDTSDITTSVLGIHWDRKEDLLFVNMEELKKPDQITKRTVLSTVAQIFDPIGMLAPALLPLKLILQKTWINDLKWDEPLPKSEMDEYKKWWNESESLSTIKIPRLMTCNVVNREHWSLHLFTDASQDAYAAVLFLRVKTEDAISVQLISSKSRVAPVKKENKKQVTIPRLELLGCLIGSRLLRMAREALHSTDVKEYCWSDSSTAIAWIQEENPWSTFVGNRVKEIRQNSRPSSWKHIPGEHNPADLPSRGCTPLQLLESKWWEGPVWLRNPESEWPVECPQVNRKEIMQELKKSETVEQCFTTLEEIDHDYTYPQLVRIMGWVNRFCYIIKRKSVMRLSKPLPLKDAFKIINENPLSNSEINGGVRTLVKFMQVNNVGNTQWGGRKQIVLKEIDGIQCVETRLTFRLDLPGFKYPMIIPRDHPITKKVIQFYHINNSHAGVNFLMSKIRETFWIPQARKTIRSVINKCPRCIRFKVKPVCVDEAPLPLDRVKDTEVFDVTGIDLAGPIFLKGKKKAWIVVYTCAVYRAVHLDLISSLSTTTFIQSMEKFIIQFGRPSTVYSDNGTNFRGADNLFQRIDWEFIQSLSKLQPILWKFNPPSAAWWGGWWERIIRTVKDLLKRTIGKGTLSKEEMKRVLWSIENALNGRPLTHVSEDMEDLQPLTPEMFLRPNSLLPADFPEADLSEADKLRKRFQYLQRLKGELKGRFRKEYLALLIAKQKEKSSRQLLPGELVYVGQDNLKRLEWPLGRIVETYPGKDGKERVVKVKTQDGYFTRPVQRIYPLELDESLTPVKVTKSGRKVQSPQRLQF